jgi:hypothetical protein
MSQECIQNRKYSSTTQCPGSLFPLFPQYTFFLPTIPTVWNLMLINRLSNIRLGSMGDKWPASLLFFCNHKPPFPTSSLSRISFSRSDKHLRSRKQSISYWLLPSLWSNHYSSQFYNSSLIYPSTHQCSPSYTRAFYFKQTLILITTCGEQSDHLVIRYYTWHERQFMISRCT